MQPQAVESNYTDIVRRSLDIEDYIQIARRYKAWIIGPMFAGLVIGVVVAFLLPNRYVSNAVIRVLPPPVPEKYVPPNVTSAISDRFTEMAQSVTSRSTLATLVTTYDLYPQKRKRMPVEDIVEGMTKDLEIRPFQPLGQQSRRYEGAAAFRVAFTYENRFLAQKVVTDVVGRIINEHLRMRASQSTMTTTFLREQWEQARKELDELEKKVTNFRVANQGRLPEQAQFNAQQMGSAQMRLSSLNSAISSINQEKLVLEAQLRSLKQETEALRRPSVPAVAGGGEAFAIARNERIAELEKRIVSIESALNTMRQQLTENHPDIKTAQSTLASLKSRRDEMVAEEESRLQKLAAEAKANPGRPAVVDPATMSKIRATDAAIEQVEAQIKARDLRLQELSQEVQNVDRRMALYQQRMEATPVGEQEYAQLVREVALAKIRYEDLTRKKEQSETATDLENRNQGETMEILESASLPQTPVSPNRLAVVGIATALGCVLGIALAGTWEVKDTSLKGLKDVRAYTNLPILGSVPLLENDVIIRRRKRMALLAWSTAVLIGIVIMSTSVYYHYATGV